MKNPGLTVVAVAMYAASYIVPDVYSVIADHAAIAFTVAWLQSR